MEKKQHNNYLVFLNILIVVYSLYISLSVFKEKAVVTDDLAGVYALRMIPFLFQLYLFFSGFYDNGSEAGIRYHHRYFIFPVEE
jgi:hypothetical protein